MKYACVIPYAYKPYYDEFVKTCKLENVLAIDNTNLTKNIGIMKSHNMGIDYMCKIGAEWLIVMSAAIRFGEPGGLDFVEQLRQHPEMDVAQGAQIGSKQDGNRVFGWHFMAFNKRILDLVGGWDENFTPYSLDDIDLSLRIRKAKPNVIWEGLECDITDTTMSHSITKAGVKASYPPRHEYFKRKWGREGGDYQNEGYAYPFNNPALDLNYCPTPDDPLSIWQNEYKNGYNFND